MPVTYDFLGLLALEPGSWAEWFSGVASAAAAIVALGGYWWSDRQRKHEKLDRERDAAKQIGIKLYRVLNGTNDIHRHISADRSTIQLEGDASEETWRKVKPLIGLTEDPTITLDAAEVNFLIDAKQTEFLVSTMLVIARYQSIVSSMKEYAIRYESVYALSPPPFEEENGIFKHRLSSDEYWKIRPYSAMLEALIQSLQSMAAENLQICKRLIGEYNPIMKAHFRVKEWLGFADPTASV